MAINNHTDEGNKNSPLKWKRAAYIAYVILFGITATYVIANVFDWHVPLLNPPEPPVTIPFSLPYPISTTVIGNSETGTFYGVFQGYVFLRSEGTIIEHGRVTIDAAGGLNELYDGVIDRVLIGFENALVCADEKCANTSVLFGPPNAAVTLDRKLPNQSGFVMPEKYGYTNFITMNSKTQWIYWPVQGDYSPMVNIVLKNGTTIAQVYEDEKVHVEPKSILSQERQGKINTAISVALVAFAFVEGARLIHEFGRGRSVS